MANVGNLFVNISGSTKGLTKALGTAKTKLAAFDKQVGRPGGDFMRRARGRFTSAMNERKDQTLRELMGAGGTEGHREMMRARIGKKEKGARQSYRQAQREQVMGGMRRQAQMTLGIIGVSIAGATMIMKKAMSISERAREGMEKFRFLGPQGAEILQSEVQTLIQRIQGAQGAGYSAARARRARLEQQSEAAAIGMGAPTAMENAKAMGEAFVLSIAETSPTLQSSFGSFLMETAMAPLSGIRVAERTVRNFLGGY